VQIDKRTAHFLTSHRTPPVFDGPEDRNGLRNADEIRFWADCVTPGPGRHIYDDQGGRGGLHPSALFVVAGDQNSDPFDGDSLRTGVFDGATWGVVGGFPTSDHRLVWADLDLPGGR
jgi:hypothetical protein